MAEVTWFVFDLGNTVVKLAYERVLENICRQSPVTRDELVDLLESPGGYRDLERGLLTFADFHDFLRDRAGYRGSARELQETWADFFDGPMPGIEDVLDRVRERYRVAFLSNSNEVHAEVIPRVFGELFRKDDRFIYSYRFHCAKPEPEMFRRALEVVGTAAQNTVYIDDLVENVIAAQSVGMRAFQFHDCPRLVSELESEGLLAV